MDMKTTCLVTALSALAAIANFAAGCAQAPAPRVHNASDHNHDRGHMMIASDGAVDALLTAHLSSKEGNELDVFVERDGKPLALPTQEIAALAKARSEKHALVFTCAPLEERPIDEALDTCSHFVARATWMQPEEPIEVEAELPLRRGQVGYVWRSFQPLKYAHHVE